MVNKFLWFAKEIVIAMEQDERNVLVHCTDGWDRTAQLWTLVQLMLDPFYRTIKGLHMLIEKDWISFGHMFEKRMGHFKNEKQDPDERSPIFIQWLDWVHQLWKQFPTAFQFNINLLSFLAHEVYTWKFGTFLFDWEYERNVMNIRRKTVSIWAYISENILDFVNPFYQKDQEYSGHYFLYGTSKSVIIPMTDYVSMSLFKEHFFKWNVEHMTQYNPLVGSPLNQMEKAMMKVMDLHTENNELK